MQMKIDKVGGYIGAEISGINLSDCDDDAVYKSIRGALNEHAVIFFRNQDLEPQQLASFGKRFGTLFVNSNPGIAVVGEQREVELMRKEADEVSNIGDEWHTDQAHRKNPCMGTILHGRVIPSYGGDTLFVNVAAAYERLPASLKNAIDGLEAVHSRSFLMSKAENRNSGDPDRRFENMDRSAEAVHPVVRRHPETGRKVLFVNPAYTYCFVGKTHEESLPLLNELYGHALTPEFGCRFRWQPNSLAFWDNRQTWHYAANDYHGHRRLMHRIMVQADT
jgi:taurine dioxygenase